LKHLAELHLHNNFIERVPTLPKSKALRCLNLNSNKLMTGAGLEHKHTPKLNELDLGNNAIRFGNPQAFTDFVLVLTKFADLKALGIAGNPFMTEHDREAKLSGIDVRRELCERLKTLDSLNGRSIAGIMQDIEAAESARAAEAEGEPMLAVGIEPTETKKVTEVDDDNAGQIVEREQKVQRGIPSLEILLRSLEEANS
jgi:hypothetical protein